MPLPPRSWRKGRLTFPCYPHAPGRGRIHVVGLPHDPSVRRPGRPQRRPRGARACPRHARPGLLASGFPLPAREMASGRSSSGRPRPGFLRGGPREGMAGPLRAGEGPIPDVPPLVPRRLRGQRGPSRPPAEARRGHDAPSPSKSRTRTATPGSFPSPIPPISRPASSANGRGACSRSRWTRCASGAGGRARRSRSSSSSAMTSKVRTPPNARVMGRSPRSTRFPSPR